MTLANLPERRSDTVVCTPTYNEGGSIGALLDALLALPRAVDIVIIDDGSTDGTREAIAARAEKNPHVVLIERQGKLGIGSRFVKGGRLDYSGWRLFVSRTANVAARTLLALSTHEQTTSLRAARLDRVPPGLIESMLSDGYSFFLSCMARFARAGLKISELPIHFRDRNSGQSKLPPFEIVRCGANLLQLAVDRNNPPAIALLPDAECTCAACGRPYLIRMEGGGIRCLACLAEPSAS
jgi:dolichol-phosphate mannosyltransferase